MKKQLRNYLSDFLKSLTLCTILGATLGSSLCSFCSLSLEAVEEERAPARFINHEQKIAFKEKMAQTEESAANEQNEGKEADSATTSPIICKAPSIKATPHQGQYHHLAAVNFAGNTINFIDGSSWKARWNDADILQNWRPNDTLLVKIAPWYTSYDYIIENIQDNSSVYANLNLTPILFGEFSLWVMDIDDSASQILLNDGSLWDIYGSDSSSILSWAKNDHVIIGNNNGLFTKSSYPHILINANMNTYIRAACLN